MPASATLRIRVTPRSGRNEIARVEGGVAHVRVAAPPVEGAANQAVVELLAEALGLRKSAVAVKSGAGSREKTVTVEGIETDEAMARLAAKAAGQKGG